MEGRVSLPSWSDDEREGTAGQMHPTRQSFTIRLTDESRYQM